MLKTFTHDPILPNSTTIPNIIFVALIHTHWYWMIRHITHNFPYTSIATRVKKRDTFSSNIFIAPLVETFM